MFVKKIGILNGLLNLCLSTKRIFAASEANAEKYVGYIYQTSYLKKKAAFDFAFVPLRGI